MNDTPKPDLAPLLVVVAKQRDLAHNMAAEQEARAIVLEQRLAAVTLERDELFAQVQKLQPVEAVKEA